jgi:hypothetical protein
LPKRDQYRFEDLVRREYCRSYTENRQLRRLDSYEAQKWRK